MAETRISGGRHQRCSAEEWREIFERRAASGLSITAFCQREGIANSSYARWWTQLSNERCNAGALVSGDGTGFIDAGLLAHCAKADTAERINLRLELGHGIVLHVVRG